MATLEDYLIEWSRWLAGQRSYEDAPSDWTGNVHVNLNQGRSVWFLAGTWGVEQNGPRTITVPTGTNLFIVAAFACATDKELMNRKRHPRADPSHPLPSNIPSPGLAHLQNRARAIDALFTEVHLEIDDIKSDSLLKTVETPMFTVDIEPSNGLATYYGYPGFQSMVSKARVALIEYVASAHKIKINAHGGSDDDSGELEYNLEVTYNVVVS